MIYVAEYDSNSISRPDMFLGCNLRSLAAGMLFGWETVMTFVLVSVVYAVAVGEPSFGNIGPFAVGLSLFSMVFAGKHLLGCC